MKEKKTIGIDIGHSTTKAFTENQGIVLSSAVSRFLTKKAANYEVNPICINEKKYIVGETAKKYGGVINPLSSSFIASEPWLAIFACCLAVNNYNDSDVVVMGIPNGAYIRKYVSKIKYNIENAFNYKQVLCRNIHIIPQGAGAYYAHVKIHPDDANESLAFIDVGYKNINFTVFSDACYIENKAETIGLGISILTDAIKKEFYREYMCHTDHVDIWNAILKEKNEIVCGDQSYQFDIINYVEWYAEQLSYKIEHFLEITPLSKAILLGGAAEYIHKKINIGAI